MAIFTETRVLPVSSYRPSRETLAVAAALLREGWPVAFPTETVYGLGGDALNPVAVRAIFRAKGRPPNNPLIVHIAEPGQLQELARKIPQVTHKLIDWFWPGPLTLVLKRSPKVPSEVTGRLDTVAVRMPAHPVALALIQEAGTPLAAPSANLSGRPSPTTAAHVLRDLNTRIPLILDGGPTSIGVESTVLDVTSSTPILLRPGGTTVEQLREVVGRVALSPKAAMLTRSPGTRHRHYQPRVEVVLVLPRAELTGVVEQYWSRGLRVGLICSETARLPRRPDVKVHVLPESISGFAKGLFAAIRALEESGVDMIVVQGVEERGLGLAVMDRLRRAASLVVDEHGQAVVTA